MKIPNFKIWILGCVTEGTQYKKNSFAHVVVRVILTPPPHQ